MAIDETRLQTALDKIATLRQQNRAEQKQLDKLYNAIIDIRMKPTNDGFDEEDKPINPRLEKPVDRRTLKTVSDQTREEVFREIIPLIEAL